MSNIHIIGAEPARVRFFSDVGPNLRSMKNGSFVFLDAPTDWYARKGIYDDETAFYRMVHDLCRKKNHQMFHMIDPHQVKENFLEKTVHRLYELKKASQGIADVTNRHELAAIALVHPFFAKAFFKFTQNEKGVDVTLTAPDKAEPLEAYVLMVQDLITNYETGPVLSLQWIQEQYDEIAKRVGIWGNITSMRKKAFADPLTLQRYTTSKDDVMKEAKNALVSAPENSYSSILTTHIDVVSPSYHRQVKTAFSTGRF